MKISVNENEMLIESSLNVTGLIRLLNLEASKIAIEINQTIVPRSNYEQYHIKQNDQIEIINAVGGG